MKGTAIATIQLDVIPPKAPPGVPHIALVGNPNAGKTTLFNALTGLRAKTANFPGTTVEHRVAHTTLSSRSVRVLDLPGLYTLTAATSEERIARDALLGQVPGVPAPAAVVLILDSTNLERNLYLASQVLELKLPTVVALNMTDLAQRAGLTIDAQNLSRELACPVVPISARTGEGLDSLREALTRALEDPATAHPKQTPSCSACSGCPHQARYDWAENIGSRCTTASPGVAAAKSERTERIDRLITHPVVGVLAFLAVMFGVFAMIFWLAQYPMGWIDSLFAHAGALAEAHMPDNDLRALLVNGVIGGVGGMLVFLPQIVILFFFLSILEDTGYLARAAFVMDRLMRAVGLPGKAFVPLLSAHACAIPAIMAARSIDDKRDRLVTILVAPLMSCSARIPVYTMLVSGLLFPHNPLAASALFTGAYLLGIGAALGSAFAFKRTILPGETRPLVLELPSYKIPSIRNAVLFSLDRAVVFVKKAGTVILLVSIILWALATYPKSEPPAEAEALTKQAETLREQANGSEEVAAQASELTAQADHLTAQSALANSYAGRIGHFIEPVIKPLGYNWQIGVGIVSSFAAREVIVSTLAVVYGVGADAADDDEKVNSLYDTMRAATRADGSPLFTAATCTSLLVFYVLAMQCFSTQAVTRRETGGWKWPIVQIVYMTALAYTAAFITFQTLRFFNIQ